MTEQLANIDQKLFEILETVSDPEIPVLSIMEMGVVRSAELKNGIVEVEITPTYSGCPAMDVIGDDIKAAFRKEGYEAKVELILSPAWTTDWMTENGKRKLNEYGIAPPQNKSNEYISIEDLIVPCPICQSKNTSVISEFGSTACKSLYRCNDCLEPFDYFKCH
jgi:ring-1,2-phenylacetyl-CoA epoxidase subunit PaaD